MKFKNRREEVMAKLAAEKEAKAIEAATQENLRISNEVRKPMLHPDHPLPTTRRQLLASGLISGMSMAVVPSIFTLAAQAAYGADCPKGQAGAGIPGYLHIEASGGFSVARNFVPGKQDAGGAFAPLAVAGYATIGYGPSQTPPTVTLNTELGGTMHPTSPLLAGMKLVMSPAALAKTVVAAVCAASNDDNANNPHNPIQLVTKIAGNPGSLLQIAGTRDTPTGGRTAALPVGVDPGLAKALIADEASLGGLVDPGLIAARFANDPAAAVQVADLASKLSASKLAQFTSQTLNSQVKNLIECGYLGAKDLLTEFTQDRLLVSRDALLRPNYNNIQFFDQTTGVPAATFTGPVRSAMIMSKLMADGFSTAGSVEIGGYDYHGQGLATQDTRDTDLGRIIGAALEVAHRKGKPMFIAVTTDGSVSTTANGAVNDRYAASADNGERSMMLMFAIGATAKPPMNFYQVGKFNDSGAVEATYGVTANKTPLAAQAVAYNYASFIGKIGEYEKQVAAAGGTNPFKGNERMYQAFAPKA